jgi:serine/threonine protein kinase
MTIPVDDGNLARAIEVEGYKVLPPCVIYGKIGQGGMGAVYRGRHLNLDIDVAVKCLKPELVGGDDQFVVRFRREARAAAQINHQNVIRVFDVAEDQGLHYLIMELVQGESARERVTRKGKLAVGEALEIVYGAALGLAEAHRKGFVHRDIKPDNIMVSSSGQVKVADLGLAKPSIRDEQASLLSGTNLVMGTPQYMPPEQWENTTNVTPAADVWALGATLYYLLVGGEAIQKDSLPRIMQRIMLQPFPDPRVARPDVPDDVAAVVAKATRTAVAERYPDAQALAEAIEHLATRRESLRDKGAGPTSQVSNQVLSPPPAKTLAKIKFWLDKQAQEGHTAPMPGPQGTIVVDGPGQTVPMLPPRRHGAWLWVAGALVVGLVLVALLAPWGRGGATGIFTEADRLEALAEYAAAIAETHRVHLADPSLPAPLKAERLARLGAAWARELAVRGQWHDALVQLERSLVQRDTPAGREQKADLLARIRTALDGKLVKEAPASEPVPRGALVQFRGRLDDPVVQSLRIAGQAIPREAGAFAATIDPGDRREVDVAVTLSSGEVLALSPWPLVRTEAGPEQPALALSLSPATLVLDGEEASELVIQVAAGVRVTVDGAPVPAEADATTHRYRVQSTADAPAPLAVEATAPDGRVARRTVPVQRAARPLAWRRPAAIEGTRVHRGQLVGRDTTLRLSGQVEDGPATLRVNGREVAAEWAADGSFRAVVEVPGPGQHTLRVALQRRFRPVLEQDLTIQVLTAPAFEFVAPTRDGEVTAAVNHPILLAVDAWTTSVSARRGGVLLRTVAPAEGGGVVRVEVALLEGANEIDVVVANAVGLEAQQRLTVTRVPGGPGAVAAPEPAGGPPRLLGVSVVDPDGQERPVERNKTVVVRSGAQLRVQASDPAAVPICRDRELTAELLVLGPEHPLVQAGSRGEIRARSAAGASEAWKLWVVVDDVPPVLAVTAPSGPVGRDVPFTCSGTWEDGRGLRSLLVNGVAARTGRGTWSAQLPGIQQPTTVTVVATDAAGNQTRQDVTVEP